MDYRKDFIVDAIRNSELSILKISKRTGLCVSTINKIVYTKSVPSFDTAMTILEAIGYEVLITKR